LTRFPRSSLFYFALVIVLGVVFWFTWQSIESGQRSGDWSYSTLVKNAQSGQVKSLKITGSEGVATDTQGRQWNVHLSDGDNQTLAKDLQSDGVDVSYSPANSGAAWLQVLIPNLILLLLIGGFMYYILRQTQSGNNQAMSFGR
jgi:cell division protease FtsH